MRRRTQVLLVAVLAACSAALAVGVATASRSIEVTPTAIRATSPALTIVEDLNGISIICHVTLEGELHRVIGKVMSALTGLVTAGRVGECTTDSILYSATGTLTLFSWHLKYVGYFGTLPSITGILFFLEKFNVLFVFRSFGATVAQCLYGGRIGFTALGTLAREFERLTVQAGQRLTLIATLEPDCAVSGTVRGTFTLATAVTMRLL